MKHISEEYLNIEKDLEIDESVQRYEYVRYLPASSHAKLSEGSEVKICIDNQDIFVRPSDSYLFIEGCMVKDNDKDEPFKNADSISLINNAIAYLFSNLSYELGGQEIEYVNELGPITTMKGILTYPYTFNKTKGLNQFWCKDNTDDVKSEGFKIRHDYLINTVTADAEKGSFSCLIPLKHIFGFCETYDKIMFGTKHVINLRLASATHDSIYKEEAVPIAKVLINSIEWHMPHIKLSDESRSKLLSFMTGNGSYEVGFMKRQGEAFNVPNARKYNITLNTQGGMKKPRYIVLGFQKNRLNSQVKNPAVFDHLNVQSAQITIDSERYPQQRLEVNFPQNKFAIAYENFCKFAENEYSGQLPQITLLEYKNVYPLLVFDLHKQPESIRNTVSHVDVDLEFREQPGPGVLMYVLILSDSMFKLKSDGSRLNIAY
jgi:hypothetical protein